MQKKRLIINYTACTTLETTSPVHRKALLLKNIQKKRAENENPNNSVYEHEAPQTTNSKAEGIWNTTLQI